MADDEVIQQVQVPVVWVGLEELPITTLSHFLVQIGAPEEILITFGQVPPPVMVGTREEQLAQAQSIPFVQGRPLLRAAMTTHRVRELIKVLQETLDQYGKLPMPPPGG